jgi:Cys-rich protein (TIGR01571 family)
MNCDFGEDVKKAAEEAAQSDIGGGGESVSSTIKTKEEDGLFEVMSSATSVVLSRRKKSTKSPAASTSPTATPTNIKFRKDPPSDRKSTPTASVTGSTTGSSAGKNLDLANNDNSFFVIANLLVDYFQSRVVKNSGIEGDDSPDAKLLLKPADKESLERLLPQKARSNFIQAVKERLGNTPSVPTSPLQFLTLQCQELNLDQDDEVNPLLAVLELTTESVLIEILPSSALLQAMASASFTATATTVAMATTTPTPVVTAKAPTSVLSPAESQTTVNHDNLTSKAPAGGVPLPGMAIVQEDDSSNKSKKEDQATKAANFSKATNFFGMSTATKNAISKPVVPAPVPVPSNKTPVWQQQQTNVTSTPTPEVRQQPRGLDPTGENDSVNTFERNPASNRTESLARQQLLAELREASNLMANSVTPETAKFWRDHVLELQARLRALHGEGTSTIGLRTAQSPTPEDILESNRRLLSEFQQREQYVPPVIDSPSLKSVEAKTESAGASGGINSIGAGAVDTASGGTPRKIDLSTTPPSKVAVLKDTATPQTPSNNNPLGPPNSRTPMNMSGAGGGGTDSTPVVDVVAPADLPGGYRFEAEIEGQRFLAVVPAGGVRQGDTFSCYMRELESVAIDIPVGYWKDGIMNWFKFGVCHQVVWNSVVCPLSKYFCFLYVYCLLQTSQRFLRYDRMLTLVFQSFFIISVLLGQITTRVDFDFIGRPRDNVGSLSNRSMMLLVICFWLLMNVGLFAGYDAKWSQDIELSIADLIALLLVNGAMFGFIVFVTQSARSSIREKFMIRENCCYDLEDLCCATFCLPCTISQMARHTANYNDYEAVCCSKSGLPDGVKVNQQAVKNNETYVV